MMYATHHPRGCVVPFRCSNESLAVPIPCMLQSLRRYQITRPGSVALHQATSIIAFRSSTVCLHDYVTSIAVDAEAATQQAMVSARMLKSASMMNDAIVSLLF